jgi:hypothetical protein
MREEERKEKSKNMWAKICSDQCFCSDLMARPHLAEARC